MMDALVRTLERLPTQTRTIVKTAAYGLAGGCIATAFHVGIGLLFDHTIRAFESASLGWFLAGSFLVVAGTSAISGWLLNSYCPEAAGSGIPQVKVAFWREMGFIRWRVVWVKFVGGILSVGGGASLGREGPSVQFAAGLTSNLAGWLGEPKQNRRLAAAAGSAAGLAAAFNTPIAAATFALEEIIGDLNSRLLGGVLLASVLGALVVQGFLGSQPSFTLHRAGAAPTLWVYGATPFVAAASTLAGVLFQRWTLGARSYFRRSQVPHWILVTAGGIAVWALGASVFAATGHDGVFGLGYGDLSIALDAHLAWKIALLLLVAKLAATSICYGLGGCGGIFAPTLFFGGMCGTCMAWLLGWVHPLTTPDQVTIAVVGMSACLGAVVRAPVTSILIVFEMTHEFPMVPVLILGALVSQAISRRFNRYNFYDAILAQDELNVERIVPPRDLRAWQETPVSRIANFRPVVADDLGAAALRHLLDSHPQERFPLVQAGQLQGILTRRAAEAALAGGEPPAIEPAHTCRRDTPIREVQGKLIESPSQIVVIVGGEQEHVIGLVTLHDLLRAELSLSQ
ncbi:MAG TPA: chloride channel protein [Opitutaceae bacterium]|nr:chloride channel protein [Opitutaceae bacterium]